METASDSAHGLVQPESLREKKVDKRSFAFMFHPTNGRDLFGPLAVAHDLIDSSRQLTPDMETAMRQALKTYEGAGMPRSVAVTAVAADYGVPVEAVAL